MGQMPLKREEKNDVVLMFLVSINYLLGNLGKPYSETVGVVDLGGGSVQMYYAISEETAANAPTPTPNPSGGGGDQDSYLAQWNLNGTTYYLYAHSYLRYGLEASRAEILKLSGDAGNPCVINGYQGTYNYSGEVYKVSVPPSGTDKHRCRALIKKALNLCPQKNCTLMVMFGTVEAVMDKTFSILQPLSITLLLRMRTWTEIYPWEYLKAANVACKTDMENVKSIYPYARDADLPYICMDLVYIYTLLVDGFGLDPKKEMRVVQNMEYKGSEFEAAWPLGCAIDSLSPLTSRLHALAYA
ncbi:hypothetical protein BUALT_Bualt05G0040400 [Buddleja alternifolia]|uniref:Apyrase n=1 Tax=Buddleja alternifolia TaxID=168488 RepID=A0AAV6XGA7_9LAMI|nr:hypothetical protein BUALT_Bualt05G0040400 [Buddleja alternifolia]